MAFGKKKDKIFTLLEVMTDNIVDASQFFKEYKITEVKDLKVFSSKLKDYETKADNYVHEMIVELNKTFITPIEREDILMLTVRLDDIIDGIDNTAAMLEMYDIQQSNEHMVEFVYIIHLAVLEIKEAINLLARKKLMDIRPHAIKIKNFETDCDVLLRKVIRELFANETDAIKIIKYKEIYESLELISDDCQNVANTLETIIMKNA